MGSILIDSKDAENSISKTGDKADGMGKKLGKGIGIAAKFGAALVVGAVAAGAGIFALGVKLGDTADNLLDLNSITGMSTTEIQKWKKAAEVAGVSTDAMTNASMKLTKNMDIMSTGTGKGAESLEKLGFSFKEIENMSADERVNVLTEALAGVDDKTERARIGTDLFGSSWKEIAPVVDLGASSMQKAKDSANIISEEDLKKANDFRIKVADMKDQLGFFVTKITIALLPALNGMMTWFGEKMPQIQAVTSTVFTFMSAAISKFAEVLQNYVIPKIKQGFDFISALYNSFMSVFYDTGEVADILGNIGISPETAAKVEAFFKVILDASRSFIDWIVPKLPEIKAGFETAFDGAVIAIKALADAIQEASKWIKDHWSIVAPILAGIAGGAVAFYAITGALTVYNAAIMFANGVGPIYVAVTGAMTTVTAAFASVLAFLTSPIFLIVAAIAVLIAVGILLYKNWDTVKEKMVLAMGWIKDKSISIFNGLVEFFKTWGLTILAVITGPIGLLALAIYKNWDDIKQKTSEIWNSIVEVLSNFGAKVYTVLGIDKLVSFVIASFNFMKDTITIIFEMIVGIIGAIFSKIAQILSPIVTNVVNFVTQKWNDLKNKTTSIFNAVKNVVLTIWSAISAVVRNVANSIFSVISSIWNKVKSTTAAIFNSVKSTISSIWNGIKTTISNAASAIWSNVKSTFDKVKNAMTSPINDAKSTIKSALDKIKGFFSSLVLKFPMPKMPKFSVSKGVATFLGKEIPIPKFNVSWNAQGGLFTKPTIFNTPMGLQGFGEAGPEAAIPLTSSVLGMIGQKISDTMDAKNASTSGQVIIVQSILDGQVIAESTHNANQQLFGASSKSSAFFNGVR